jgi:hypothetical protein
MNYITNDRNEPVIAIGAPGSVARARVEWPALIDRLNGLYSRALEYRLPGCAVDETVLMIRTAGVTSEMETSSILQVSDYGQEPQGSVPAIIITIGQVANNATI